MSEVLKTFKGAGTKTIYGYKNVLEHKKKGQPIAYGPRYVRRYDRWEIGKWYKPIYTSCDSYISTITGKKIMRHGPKSKIIDLLRNTSIIKNVIPVIWTQGTRYECGFHFFTDLRSAYRYMAADYELNKKLVFCEFKNIVAEGEQWQQGVKVARKMKIIRVMLRNYKSKKKEIGLADSAVTLEYSA
jgi:hypothetical protein